MSDTIAGAWWLAVICAGTVIGIVRWVWGSKHVCAVDTLIVCSVVVVVVVAAQPGSLTGLGRSSHPPDSFSATLRSCGAK